MQRSAHDQAYLRSLLARRNQDGALQAHIDAEIEAAFVRQVAILVLDMCGFTSTTSRHGIIHFLAMVHQMEQAARPAVEANGGEVVKQEADNLFAVFTEPTHALEAALDIRRALDAMNAVRPPQSALYASMGIGYGRTLVVAHTDLYGAEMNFACKLGEDVAGPGEILLTSAAAEALAPGRYRLAEITPVVGGVAQSAYALQACLVERPLAGP